MPKRKSTSLRQHNVAHLQPDELNALKELIKEFVGRIENIDNEIELLKEDRKTVLEEYSDRLDMKTLQAALRVIKIQKGVEHKDTFDTFLEALNEGQ